MALPDTKDAEIASVSPKKANESVDKVNTIQPKAKTKQTKSGIKKQHIPRGQAKSGRPWKEPKQK